MDIVLVESAWDIFAALLIVCAGAVYFAQRPIKSIDSTMSMCVYIWHTLFCIYYAWFTLDNSADAPGYFRRSFNPRLEFGLGTKGVDAFTAIFTQGLNLSYIGVFLVFNIIGAIGLAAYAGALRETLATKSRNVHRLSMLFIFLPGVSFWSVAIGKDALAFFGTGLLAWGILNIRQRWVAILLAVLAYTLVRPHVVAVIVIALTASVIFSNQMSAGKKIVLGGVSLAICVVALQFALSAIGLGDIGTSDDVYEFLEYRQSVNLEGGSSIDISSMNIALRLFYCAFGPLFVGVGGIMGLVASLENLMILGVVLRGGINKYKVSIDLPSGAKWFYLVFALTCWVIFSNTTANLGIALRQKWMYMPMLLLFVLSSFPNQQREAV